MQDESRERARNRSVIDPHPASGRVKRRKGKIKKVLLLDNTGSPVHRCVSDNDIPGFLGINAYRDYARIFLEMGRCFCYLSGDCRYTGARCGLGAQTQAHARYVTEESFRRISDILDCTLFSAPPLPSFFRFFILKANIAD